MKKSLIILLASTLCVLLAACGSTAPASSTPTPEISAEVISESTPEPSEPAVSEPEENEPELSETESDEPETTEDVPEYPAPPAGGDGATTLDTLNKFWADFFTSVPAEEKRNASYEDIAEMIGAEGILSIPANASPGHVFYKWVAPSQESIYLEFSVRDDGVYYFYNGAATGIKVS